MTVAGNDNKKLTRVVSTKLSIEDDNFLQQESAAIIPID
jgi:hypothetical protein